MSQTDDGRLAIAAGLAGGGQLRARLELRGAGRVVEFLNNWVEPTLVLGSTLDPDSSAASVVIVRAELVWMTAVEAEPVPWIPNGSARFSAAALPQARQVIVHAGPFELRGALHTYADASWPDFLHAHSGPSAFFSLADAHITGPGSSLDVSAVAVNGDRVAALLSSN